MPTHLGLAVLSGAAAALASVFSKCAAQSEDAVAASPLQSFVDQYLSMLGLRDKIPYSIIIRGLFVGGVVGANVAMWFLFTRALNKAPSTAQVTVINNAANMCFSALFGYLLFDDMGMITSQWWAGVTLLLCGSALIIRGEDQSKKSAKRPVAGKSGVSTMQADALQSSAPSSCSSPTVAAGPRVFVTVGTTSFTALVDLVTSIPFLQALSDEGFRHITIQHGRSPIMLPVLKDSLPLTMHAYAFKPNLAQDVESADLIISHAGTGSILEALYARKKLIVVVNQTLMDNHQVELADVLDQQNHVVKADVHELVEQLAAGRWKKLKEFEEADSRILKRLLNETVGFD
ncbi:N-acetylglucosaminyldiphosphodolichol N-acetylglucosaminyltransferase catalytic subunit alg13 [Gaertneriomyces sp. JEL0708]|nr:N-acetylglucosaminyldiphosphodolichol N-acetylglucosaminyltransferase catalytic subunit alg13 [Gaertneriomyces sp. JEL0708]